MRPRRVILSSLLAAGALDVDMQDGVLSGGIAMVGGARVKARKKRRTRLVNHLEPSTLTQYWS